MPGRVCNVLQEGMRVSLEQWHIPLKFHAEAGARLFLGCRLVTIVHMDLKIGMRRQPPKPARMVLDGMSAEYREPVRRCHPTHLRFRTIVLSRQSQKLIAMLLALHYRAPP